MSEMLCWLLFNWFLIVDVKHFTNFDLDNIVTPVNAEALENILKDVGYDAENTTFLINGFKKGFDIGYEGTSIRQKQITEHSLYPRGGEQV